MSRINSLTNCKSGRDFLGYAESHGASVRTGKGSHFMVTTSKGGVCVPYHASHDLGTGLRHKLVKAFISIGILVLFFACILSYGVMG